MKLNVVTAYAKLTRLKLWPQIRVKGPTRIPTINLTAEMRRVLGL